jgi:O-antigen/teichoic acid export membrane protein
VLPLSLSRSLVASGVRRLSGFSAQLRLTLRFSVAAWVLANVGLLVLGGLVLRFYGPEYAQRGRLVLLLVCLGGLGVIVKDHHVSVARVVGRVGREAALVWTFSIAEMVLAAIGARLGGLQGLAAGWLCATLVEGLVYLPLVWRARSGRLPAPAGPRPEVAGGPVP